ncbi:MAG TPA: hypothetical protein VE243_02115, partial [Candidatus Acidoferrum sp.]|nr:hypothetical protein [Candidatus Acidoferrum sp.]
MRVGTTMFAIALILFAAPRIGMTADGGGDVRDLVQFRQEIETLKGSEAAERKRVEQDEKHIQELENQLKRLETQNQKFGKTASTLEIDETKFKGDTDQRLQELQTQFVAKTSQTDFQTEIGRYLGSHQLTLTGAAAGSFIYDKQTAQNTFSLEFEPLFLYRLNDWILFEGTVKAALPPGSG